LFVRDDGNVGSGTTSPAVKLEVVTDSSANVFSSIRNSTATTGNFSTGWQVANGTNRNLDMAVRNDGVTTSRWGTTLANLADITAYGTNIVGFAIGTLTNTPLILGTQGTNRINITGGGNVGIGTSSPTTLLHVAGTIRTDSAGASPSFAADDRIDGFYTNNNTNTAMGEPDVWLQMDVNGTAYVFPGYQPNV
jgi:hypothetical protein